MTEDEAIVIATQHLAELHQEHAGFRDARFMSAERLNAIVDYQKFEDDIWAVEFWKRLAADVVSEAPDTIIVIVAESSRLIFILPSP